MERANTENLTLQEINQRFGLPEDNDFSKYFDKYDNGLLRLDRNYMYTAYFSSSSVTYIITIWGDTWTNYISNNKKKDSSRLKLCKVKDGFISKEKLEKAKLEFNNSVIECYSIASPNVSISYYVVDSEVFDALEKQIKPSDNNPYDDIPYLGLPDYEKETGHWNID
jgi:hypothetical protein